MVQIQVINRALTIVEFLAEFPDRPRTLTEIAGHAGLNQATCSHIIKTLVARDYVEQAGPRQGYSLGPMVYHLTAKESSRKRIALAVERPAYELAAELREDVVVSILRGGRKFIICQAEGNNEVQLSKSLRLTDDVYQTATGRVLIAHLDKAGLDGIMAAYGMPGERWPGCGTRKALMEKLAVVRNDDLAINDSLQHAVYLAVPIRMDGKVAAALGVSVPKYRFVAPHSENVLAALKSCAAKIGEA